MFITLSNFIHTRTKTWMVAVLLLIFALFIVVLLPIQSRHAAENYRNAGSPDTSLIYTPADLYRMAEAYGSPGRSIYIRDRFTFDLVWPLVYAGFLAVCTSWLVKKMPGISPKWRLLNILPVFAMLADYTENITASLVMGRYPLHTPGVDYLAPIFTLVKWLFIYSSFIAIILIFFIVVWRTIFPKKISPNK